MNTTAKRNETNKPPEENDDSRGTDWEKFDALSDEEVVARAKTDPDNPPLTDEDMRRMKPLPRIRAIRRALRLTEQEFADRFGVPVKMIPEWESGRVEPSEAEHAYFKIIAVDPKFVKEALSFVPGSEAAE